jgi:transposase
LKDPVQYGSSVFSRIVYLNQYQLLPVARTAETMIDLFECPISQATIQKAAKVCSHQLFRFEYRLKVALRRSDVMGVDETGININSKTHWVHVARTEKLEEAAVI